MREIQSSLSERAMQLLALPEEGRWVQTAYMPQNSRKRPSACGQRPSQVANEMLGCINGCVTCGSIPWGKKSTAVVMLQWSKEHCEFCSHRSQSASFNLCQCCADHSAIIQAIRLLSQGSYTSGIHDVENIMQCFRPESMKPTILRSFRGKIRRF